MDPLKQTFHVRYAHPDDLADLLRLRRTAEVWLANAGIEQWTDPQKGVDDITGALERGTTFAVTTAAGDVVGSLTLDSADLAFWTPAEASEPALYLYKFILGPDRRGTGLGDVLLDWACERAENVGARWLRLDCWRDNTALHNYYLKRGFQHLDTRDHPVRKSGALFERPSNLRTVAAAQAPVTLVDQTKLNTPSLPPFDRYDPTGEALIWWRAAQMVQEMAQRPEPDVEHPWRTALEQAASQLGVMSKDIRRANGSYYRLMNGSTGGY